MNYCSNSIQNIPKENLPIVATGISCWEDIANQDASIVKSLIDEALSLKPEFNLKIPLELSIMSDFLNTGEAINIKEFSMKSFEWKQGFK